MQKNKSKGFMYGALILMIGNALVKVIGFLFKIPLMNLIGDDGSGLFHTAYNMYTTLFTISTAGLPVAVSKMISESRAKGRYFEAQRIFKVAFMTFLVVGTAAFCAMFFGADVFVRSVNNSRAYYSVLAISPAIFFVAIISTFRGYFQGHSDMLPTAVSQIVEALCKLFIGLAAAYAVINFFAVPEGQKIEIASAAAMSGVTIGTIISALVLFIIYIRRRKERNSELSESLNKESRSSKELFKTLVKIAVPITIGVSVMSLTTLVDLMLVMNRLANIGYTDEQANVLYGAYMLAVTIFNLPPAIISSISVSIIPVIAAAFATQNFEKARKNIYAGLRIVILIAMPAGAGLFMLSMPIAKLIFPNVGSLETVSSTLSLLGIATISVCICYVTNAMLQAIGKVNIPVKNMLIGGLIKLISNYILVGIPSLNITGAPISSNLCYGTIAVLNIFALIKHTGIKLNISKTFIRPLGASAGMGIFAILAYDAFKGNFGGNLSTLVSIFLSAIVYIILLVFFGAAGKEELEYIPGGKKILNLLKKR